MYTSAPLVAATSTLCQACNSPSQPKSFTAQRPLTGTNLYCLVTEAHRCEQLAQGCYSTTWQLGLELATIESQVRCPSHETIEHLHHTCTLTNVNMTRYITHTTIILPLLVRWCVYSFIIPQTRCNLILNPLRASRLDMESQKTIDSSLLWQIRIIASDIAYSSAVKVLALFGSLAALVMFLWTTAVATRSSIQEPSVYNLE